MLSRTKAKQLFELHTDRTSFFSRFPPDLINELVNTYDPNPKSDIALLLHDVAHCNSEAVQTRLKAKPRLLLQAGNVLDPATNQILRVTPYECALGAGDWDMAARIASYFPALPNGREERVRQAQPYLPLIETLLEQQPDYELSMLFKIVKESSDEDITAAQNRDFNQDSKLSTPYQTLLRAVAPRKINGMHFNYANLLMAFRIYDEFISGHSQVKSDFWKKIISYIQWGLPACDRLAFDQNLYKVVEMNGKFSRNTTWVQRGSSPGSNGHDSPGSLEFEWDGWERFENAYHEYDYEYVMPEALERYVSIKKTKLKELLQTYENEAQASNCAIC